MALFFIVYVFSLEFYHLDNIADALKWIFLIFPHFALSHSLNSVNVITQTEQMCRVRCELDANCSEELMCKLVPSCCGRFLNTTFYCQIVYIFLFTFQTIIISAGLNPVLAEI